MDSWIGELGYFQLVGSWIRGFPAAANSRIQEFVNSEIRLVNSGIQAPVNGKAAGYHLWCGHFGARMAQDSGALPDTVSTLGNVFWYFCRGVY